MVVQYGYAKLILKQRWKGFMDREGRITVASGSVGSHLIFPHACRESLRKPLLPLRKRASGNSVYTRTRFLNLLLHLPHHDYYIGTYCHTVGACWRQIATFRQTIPLPIIVKSVTVFGFIYRQLPD